MTTIPANYSELDLNHLRVLDVLLREHSLTRAALALNVTQPALSKTLARLRTYFDDPLFVRVALRMEPTPKALDLQEPVAAILQQMRELRSEHVPFDPATSIAHVQFLRRRCGRHQAAAKARQQDRGRSADTCGCA